MIRNSAHLGQASALHIRAVGLWQVTRRSKKDVGAAFLPRFPSRSRQERRFHVDRRRSPTAPPHPPCPEMRCRSPFRPSPPRRQRIPAEIRLSPSPPRPTTPAPRLPRVVALAHRCSGQSPPAYSFSEADHLRLRDALRRTSGPWVLSQPRPTLTLHSRTRPTPGVWMPVVSVLVSRRV